MSRFFHIVETESFYTPKGDLSHMQGRIVRSDVDLAGLIIWLWQHPAPDAYNISRVIYSPKGEALYFSSLFLMIEGPDKFNAVMRGDLPAQDLETYSAGLAARRGITSKAA